MAHFRLNCDDGKIVVFFRIQSSKCIGYESEYLHEILSPEIIEESMNTASKKVFQKYSLR